MVFVRGVVDGLWGLSHDFERLQRNSRCCPAPSSEVEAQLFGGGYANDIEPYTVPKSKSKPASTLEISSSQSSRDVAIEFESAMSMNDGSAHAEGAFERLPCTICISASEPLSPLDIPSSQSYTDFVIDPGNTMLSESTSEPLSILDIISSRSSRDDVIEFENAMALHAATHTISKSTLEPVSTLDISSSRSPPRDVVIEFENAMTMHDATHTVSKSTLEPVSTLDISSSRSLRDVAIEFEKTMAMHVAPYAVSKATLNPLSSSQSSKDVVLEFENATAMSALQASFDPRFIYTYTLVLVAALLLIYKVMRASPSSSNAESLEESLLFLHPDKLHEHHDHHRHPQQQPQRPRTASSDVGDESVLSISHDTSMSVASEEEDFPFQQLVPEATAAFEEEDFQLEQLVPEATVAERFRFLVTETGNVRTAAKTLKAYLQWRSDHQHTQKHGEPALLELELYTDDSDWNDWNIAAAAACKANKETSRTFLPRIARLHKIEGNDIRDRQGYRVLRLISGQMDDRLVSLTTYATAVALYIDRKLARESTETVTLCIDLRGGPGWRNLHVVKVLHFIRTTTKLLLTMFPGRLERAVVYPLTPAFRWIWPICKRWIDPLTAEKICVLTGPATIVSPPPLSQMIKYLDESSIALLEKAREADFVTSSPDDSLQQS